MFDILASERETGPLGGGVASALVHAALISGAVLLTLQTRVVAPPRQPVVPLTWYVPLAAGLPGMAPPLAGTPLLALPGVVPAVIPPPSTAPFDPARFAGHAPGPVTLALPRTSPPAGDVYAERWVEDPPELIAHPAARYPEVLRRAGVAGRVVVEAVIDTAGRVEPGTVRVVTSSNPLFDAPAREVVAGSRYRPGRVDGRPVRVRVTVPVAFQVSGRSPIM